MVWENLLLHFDHLHVTVGLITLFNSVLDDEGFILETPFLLPFSLSIFCFERVYSFIGLRKM